MLLHEVLPLTLTHLFQLEIASMGLGPEATALHDDEENGTHNGNEVKREIHEVANDSCGCELGKRSFNEFAQSCNGVAPGLHLAAFRDYIGHVLGNEGLVRG
jgi:hypothetical protein